MGHLLTNRQVLRVVVIVGPIFALTAPCIMIVGAILVSLSWANSVALQLSLRALFDVQNMRNLLVSSICRDMEELMPMNLTLDELSHKLLPSPSDISCPDRNTNAYCNHCLFWFCCCHCFGECLLVN